MAFAIEARQLKKVYEGRTKALDGVDLQVNPYLTRYEDVLHESDKGNYTTTLGISRKADHIKVDAIVDMYTTDHDYKYAFDYKADVHDGVIETKDATGWSNRTGSRRIDFEHDSLMSGDELNITNELVAEGYFFPGAPGEKDWLPCCLPSGTSPPIEVPEDSYWPNQGTYGVLSPDKLLPDNTTCCPECTPEKLADCYEKCNKYNGTVNKEHCLDDCNETCTNFTCTKANCRGFECINDYAYGLIEEDESETKVARTALIAVPTNQYKVGGKTGNETPVTYEILIKNEGNTKLTNVTLIDHIPEGSTYVSSRYENEIRWGKLPEPEKGHDEIGRTLTWQLSDFDADVQRWIYVTMKNDTAADYIKNIVNVTSLSDPGRIWVNATSTYAEDKESGESGETETFE